MSHLFRSPVRIHFWHRDSEWIYIRAHIRSHPRTRESLPWHTVANYCFSDTTHHSWAFFFCYLSDCCESRWWTCSRHHPEWHRSCHCDCTCIRNHFFRPQTFQINVPFSHDITSHHRKYPLLTFHLSLEYFSEIERNHGTWSSHVRSTHFPSDCLHSRGRRMSSVQHFSLIAKNLVFWFFHFRLLRYQFRCEISTPK